MTVYRSFIYYNPKLNVLQWVNDYTNSGTSILWNTTQKGTT